MQDQYLKLKFFLVIIFILFFTLSIRKKLLGLKVKVNKPFPCMSTYLLVCHLVKTVTVTLCLCLVAQSCPTLCDPMDYIAHQAPLSTGTPQARILEWVAMPSFRGSSLPRDQTQVSCSAGRFFTLWATREAPQLP